MSHLDTFGGRRVTVVGAARSGRAAARMLASEGATVFVTEHGEPPDPDLEALFDREGIAYEFGGHTDRALEADWAVLSPGVPETAPIVRSLEERGVPTWGELEVAWRFWEGSVIAVTGTNGKTTTVRMIEAIFEAAERPHVLAGNVGVPLSRCAREGDRGRTAILEVSSFQLDRIERFRPEIAVLLNISPDHLNRYDGDLERYARSKARIFENQRSGEVALYNGDDDRVRARIETLSTSTGPVRMPFSLHEERDPGAYLGPDARAILHLPSGSHLDIDMSELTVLGPHNRQNALAAAAAAATAEVSAGVIGPALEEFEGMPHRLELVRELRGVQYVNDSKATNVEALRWALESFEGPVILIAGGRDKGNDYGTIARLVEERVAAVLALGESREKVIRELGVHAGRAERIGSMEEAVRRAAEIAPEGGTVLLSPACSSFDMFEDYRHRGRTFKRAVETL